MIKLDGLKSSSELSLIRSVEDDKYKNHEQERQREAQKIVVNFLDSIMRDTLDKDTINDSYEYDVDSKFVISHIRDIVDDILFTSFKNNVYALPDTFCVSSNNFNPSNKIVIHATNTIRFITATDKKIEREILDLFENRSSVNVGNNMVIYTNFYHFASLLPSKYMVTRSAKIIKLIKDKGYDVNFEPKSMYFTISMK